VTLATGQHRLLEGYLRISELKREVENLTDAICSGLLRPSPALATRLQAAENELAQLQKAQDAPRVALIAVNVRKRYLAMVDVLANRREGTRSFAAS
jgi:hypothetical protein